MHRDADHEPADRRRHVVILGSGFGGLFAAQALNRPDIRITLIARTTNHLFQPLLYQVATGILSEGEIAPATREVLRTQRNVRVILGDVTDLNLEQRTVTSQLRAVTTMTPFDDLIVATGVDQSYFGNDHFSRFAPGMKTVDDALELRGRIFGAFEMAEVVTDPIEQQRQLTFVVVGAGPTGVEMAGQIAELARRTLPKDFRQVRTEHAHIVLLDAGPAVLPTFGHRLGEIAHRDLTRLGVDVRVNTRVKDVSDQGVTVLTPDGTEEFIPSACKIWAAGVSGGQLARTLAAQVRPDAPEELLDRSGRVIVEPDCSLPGHPHVYVVGDLMSLNGYPGVAQTAIQSARHVAGLILADTDRPGSPRPPFRYHDKGSMATISRFTAVASIGRARFGGFPAWALWLVLHLFYIVGFKRQLTALLHWTVSFLGRGRSERTITRQQIAGRLALQELGEDFPRVTPAPDVRDEERPPTRP